MVEARGFVDTANACIAPLTIERQCYVIHAAAAASAAPSGRQRCNCTVAQAKQNWHKT